jgi:type I restriction enzyme M protein
VGSDYPADLRTRETADMFMALIVKKLLKENGRAAVVLPDGFLFGDGIKATLKKLLLRDCKLHTIVRLPKGVFAPTPPSRPTCCSSPRAPRWTMAPSTSTPIPSGSTSTRTRPGYKSYSKTKPIRFEEFKPEQDWWGSEANDFADRVENEFAWKVTSRPSANRLKPLRSRTGSAPKS